jgi:hypothetical protein
MKINGLKVWMAGAVVLGVLAWLSAGQVLARGSGPDKDGRVIPYRGHLELNGQPVTSASVPMTFTVRGVMAGGTTQTWTFGPTTVNVYAGEFSTLIGQGAAVPDWVYAAEQTYVAVSVNGVALSGESRIYPVPYATWTAEGRDLLVEGSMTVRGPLDVQGTVQATGEVLAQGEIRSASAIRSMGDIVNRAASGSVAPSSRFAFRDHGTDEWLRLRTSAASETYASLAVKKLYADELLEAPALHTRYYRPRLGNWDLTGDLGPGGGAAIVNDNVTYKALMVVGNSTAGGARRVGLWDDVAVHGGLSVDGNICAGGHCGVPFIPCNWSGVRGFCGDCGGCEDDFSLTCTNGRVTAINVNCP